VHYWLVGWLVGWWSYADTKCVDGEYIRRRFYRMLIEGYGLQLVQGRVWSGYCTAPGPIVATMVGEPAAGDACLLACVDGGGLQ
jgi:hypothetical protein